MSKMHGNGVWSGLAQAMRYTAGVCLTQVLITAIACKAEGAAHIYREC